MSSENSIITSSKNLLLKNDNSDKGIIEAYLERRDIEGDYVFSPTTQKSYIKEYRRLIIFCKIERKTFADISFEDTQNYILFVKSPPQHLIGTKKLPFGHKDWKPFFTPLSGASIRQAIAPLKSLWTFLQKINYLTLNPWALISTKTNKVRNESALRKMRVVPTDLIKLALKYLSEAEPTRKLNRQRWLFVMYLYTGSRLSDVINHGTENFQFVTSKGKSFWVFDHVSKGGVSHSTTVPEILIQELKNYRRSLDKAEFPSSGEPLVFSLSGLKKVKHRDTIHKEMKQLFNAVSQYVAREIGEEYAQIFKKASTHWLKHSFVSIALDVSDGDIRRVTDLARHSDWRTTKSYDSTDLIPLSEISEKIASSLNEP